MRKAFAGEMGVLQVEPEQLHSVRGTQGARGSAQGWVMGQHQAANTAKAISTSIIGSAMAQGTSSGTSAVMKHLLSGGRASAHNLVGEMLALELVHQAVRHPHSAAGEEGVDFTWGGHLGDEHGARMLAAEKADAAMVGVGNETDLCLVPLSALMKGHEVFAHGFQVGPHIPSLNAPAGSTHWLRMMGRLKVVALAMDTQ